VIEWSHLQNEVSGSEETFQIIIYDRNYYPTPTGDNEIKFQYKVVNNNNNDQYDCKYATVGIEDHTGTIGLEYTFRNDYPSSCKTLQNQMAILFTTRTSGILEPPHAVFSDDQFSFVIIEDEEDNDILQISNEGESNLVYSIVKDYDDSRDVEIKRDSGGPDNFGYQWIDSNEPAGPDFNWVDITTIGTQLSLDDDDHATVSLPFTFNFYGFDHASVKISSNGYLTFGNTAEDWNNDPIPHSNQPNDFIAPFWDDLMPEGGSWGDVYYYSDVLNDRFIVEYHQVSHWTSSNPRDPETFEVILYENGRILFQYLVATDEGDITVGIENPDASDGLQISYNDGSYLENGLAILIKPVLEWCVLDNPSGIIFSGSQEDITITVSSDELEIGQYLCDLIISTNDPESSLVSIPVNVEVVSDFLSPPSNIRSFVNENSLRITWDQVQGAASYSIFSSTDPYLPFAFWTLEASGITNLFWDHTLSGEKRFFKVVAEN
jgi:hypothetical protein